MARLRAVVMIHPAALVGSPVDGHRCTAVVNASWTASSAMSMSPKTRTRTATAPVQRGVEVGCLDDGEPAEVLLAFGVGPVGHQQVAVLDPYDGRGARVVQSAGEHPGAGGLHLLVERVEVAHDRLKQLGFEGGPVGLVDAEQVLGHGGLLLGAGTVPASSSIRTARGGIDIENAGPVRGVARTVGPSW